MIKIKRELFWIIPNIVIMVSISLILCYLMNKINETYVPIDSLSDKYYDITIDNPDTMQCEELLELFDDDFEIYRIQKYADKGYTPVYLKNTSLNIDMTSGREFSEDDFRTHNNVIIISDELLDGTYQNEGISFFSIDNDSYEVIGTFKKRENSINNNSDCFVSMCAANYLKTGTSNGRYFLDNVSDDEFSDVTYPWVRKNETIFDLSFEKRLILVKDTTIVPFKIIACLFTFFIGGSIFLFVLWITSQRQLINICYICGGEKNKIRIQLYLKWLCISGFGCIISILTSLIVLYDHDYVLSILALLILLYTIYVIIINSYVRNTVRKEI